MQNIVTKHPCSSNGFVRELDEDSMHLFDEASHVTTASEASLFRSVVSEVAENIKLALQ